MVAAGLIQSIQPVPGQQDRIPFPPQSVLKHPTHIQIVVYDQDRLAILHPFPNVGTET